MDRAGFLDGTESRRGGVRDQLNAQVGIAGDQAVVRASGSVVGHLPAQLPRLFAQIHGQSSVGTQVYIRPSADGPQVRLLANENLRPLLDKPSSRICLP